MGDSSRVVGRASIPDDMVDLSRVLGDVYAHSDEAAARVPQGPEAPDWADDARLDEAFRRWRPGPPVEAPAAERMFAAPSSTLADASGGSLGLAVAAPPRLALPNDGLEDGPPAAYVPGTPAAAFDRGGLSLDGSGHPPAGSPAATADALSEAVADAFAEAVAAEMSGRPRWSRDNDDILPGGKRGRGGLRFRRR